MYLCVCVVCNSSEQNANAHATHGRRVMINEYKLPEYCIFSICSHLDINLPIIRHQRLIEIKHYFWSNCSRVYRSLDRCHSKGNVSVMTLHGKLWHSVDPNEAQVWLIYARQPNGIVAYRSPRPTLNRFTKQNVDSMHNTWKCRMETLSKFHQNQNGKQTIHSLILIVSNKIIINKEGMFPVRNYERKRLLSQTLGPESHLLFLRMERVTWGDIEHIVVQLIVRDGLWLAQRGCQSEKFG